jgi:hypothetical protein
MMTRILPDDADFGQSSIVVDVCESRDGIIENCESHVAIAGWPALARGSCGPSACMRLADGKKREFPLWIALQRMIA